MKVIKHSVELVASTMQPNQLLEAVGRTCYKSEDKITEDSASRFVEMATQRGHHSVIEHASATFRIITDRGITHEIVRHRLASYSQESTRYRNYGWQDMQFVVPQWMVGREASDEYAMWMRACTYAENMYKMLIDRDVKPQVARSVLPNCLKTEIVMTANFREWRHFCSLRASAGAHPDIRIIAYAIWGRLLGLSSAVFADLDTNDMCVAANLYEDYYYGYEGM